MKIRKAERSDYARILEIYNPYIRETCFTLELTEVPLDVFTQRLDRITQSYPLIVAENDEGTVVGYAYLSPFHERLAYRFTCDISIYCAMDCRRSGIGSALYDEIEKIARESGFRNIVSVITSANTPSLAFHYGKGYKTIGSFEHVAYKLGRWLGVHYLMKSLDDSDEMPFFTGEFGPKV